MATLRQLPGTPDVLIVGSKSTYLSEGDYREKLRNILYRQTSDTSPVFEGSHDFWIAYPVPALPGHTPNHAWEDGEAAPRRLRGIVEMGDVPLRDGRDVSGAGFRQALCDEIHTLLQEVGHHWLVPDGLQLAQASGHVRVAEVHDLVSSLNDGSWPDEPPLLGRGNGHWSVFVETQGSPFDGQSYKASGPDRGHMLWDFVRAPHGSVDPTFAESVGAVRLQSGYSDLDLMVMGILDEAEVYPNDDGRFHWLQPRWTRPLPYQIGLFVAFEGGQYDFFGYYERPDVMAVASTDGSLTSLSLPVGAYPIDRHGMVLRVVRKGTDTFFQARPDRAYDHPATDTVHGFFDDIDDPQAPDPTASWDRFKTVAVRSNSAPVVGIGLIVRKWDHPFLAEGRFFNLEMADQVEGRHGWRLTDVPAVRRGDLDYMTLTENSLVYHRPSGGPVARTSGHRLYLNAPFSVLHEAADDGFRHYPHFDLQGADDRAPRLVVRPPAGDFAFGSSVRVARAIMTPWAGGAIADKQMFGVAHSFPAGKVVVPAATRNKQPAPRGDRYKMAFIVVAQDAGKVPDTVVEQLDILRHYWDAAFAHATRDRRTSYSELRAVAGG